MARSRTARFEGERPEGTRPALQLRRATEADREFLYRTYASTRTTELAQVPWTDEQKEQFLRFQFEAQSRHYAEHFPEAPFDVIEIDGRPAGRLSVDRRADELRIVDIALLPEFRGGGAGARLVGEVIDEARSAGLPVRIHVERENPAMRLYHRLGFSKLEEQGVYDLMEWRSAAVDDTQSRTAVQEIDP